MSSGKSLFLRVMSSVRALAVITLIKVFLQFSLQLVLVRVLAPAIFGQFVIVQMAIGFFELFSTLQGRKFVIKHGLDTQKTIDAIFTLELILGACVALVLAAGSGKVAHLFGNPGVALYLSVAAATLIFNPFIVTLNAIFERNMDFFRSNVSSLSEMFISAIVSVWLAFLGFGIWALVYGLISGKMAGAIALWQILPYRPKLYLHKDTLKKALDFGLPITLSGIVAYFYTNIDKYMVSKFLGNEQLGYYWFSFTIPNLLLAVQANADLIIFPAFANAKDSGQLERGFIRATKLSAIVFLFPCAIALVYGAPLVKFIFGDKWLPAIMPLTIFMFSAAVRSIFFSHWVSVFINKGRTVIMLYLGLLNLLLIGCFGYIIVPKYGITGMAVMILATAIFDIPLCKFTLKKIISFSYSDMLFPQFIVFSITFAVGMLFRYFFTHSLIMLMGSLVALLIIYISCLRLFDRQSFFECVNLSKLFYRNN